MKLLSDPDNVPAMLNCAHGKDRTGLVTALVLICFGKSKEFIALDYAKSEVSYLHQTWGDYMTKVVDYDYFRTR